MTMWLLILAYHSGGNITMRPADKFQSLKACTEAGRIASRVEMGRGNHAATMCQEVKR